MYPTSHKNVDAETSSNVMTSLTKKNLHDFSHKNKIIKKK